MTNLTVPRARNVMQLGSRARRLTGFGSDIFSVADARLMVAICRSRPWSLIVIVFPS
jgi:hypothetical protein